MRSVLLVFLPIVIAYGVTLSWVVDRWNAPTLYYQHGWLLPLVAAYVIFSRRARWSRTLAMTDRRAWWLLGPGLFLHLAGALLMIDSLSASSLILVVPGAAWLVFGRARLRGLWPVLWLVLFAVPPPIYLEGRVVFTLKEFAVDGGAVLANLFGAEVARANANLLLEGTGQALYVADACGGLRSLLAMITVGYCVAFFLGSASWGRRALIMAVTVPLAVGANIVRIAMLCLMARWFGVPFAEGMGHTLANVAEWVVAIGLLIAFDAFVSRWFGSEAADDPGDVSVPPVAAARSPALRGSAIVLWLLTVPLLGLSLYRPGGTDEERANRLPSAIASYELVPRTQEEEREFQERLPRWGELLGTRDFVWRQYRHEAGASVSLVALFHDANWKSVHPPRICIEGSNMEIEVDDVLEAPWLAGGCTVGRIIARSRSTGWRYLTLSVFGTDDWLAGSYSEFTWHHLPRALLRRSESGFLLRVETPIGPSETNEAAALRCAAFLAGLVPEAREVLEEPR